MLLRYQFCCADVWDDISYLLHYIMWINCFLKFLILSLDCPNIKRSWLVEYQNSAFWINEFSIYLLKRLITVSWIILVEIYIDIFFSWSDLSFKLVDFSYCKEFIKSSFDLVNRFYKYKLAIIRHSQGHFKQKLSSFRVSKPKSNHS